MYDKLIKRLRETSIDFGELDHVSVMMIEAADSIEELQKQLDNAEIENIKLKEEFAKYRAKHRWIPVTERLPERAFKEILPKYPYSNWMWISRNDDMWLGRYNVEEKEWYVDFGEVVTGVTHWMPTPEPPESEGE